MKILTVRIKAEDPKVFDYLLEEILQQYNVTDFNKFKVVANGLEAGGFLQTTQIVSSYLVIMEIS
jgi:hypothetical protein